VESQDNNAKRISNSSSSSTALRKVFLSNPLKTAVGIEITYAGNTIRIPNTKMSKSVAKKCAYLCVFSPSSNNRENAYFESRFKEFETSGPVLFSRLSEIRIGTSEMQFKLFCVENNKPGINVHTLTIKASNVKAPRYQVRPGIYMYESHRKGRDDEDSKTKCSLYLGFKYEPMLDQTVLKSIEFVVMD
jgi:hypothetical protein